MKLEQLSRELKEMLCAQESFRRLGFAADDIFVSVGIDPAYGPLPQVFVSLVTGHGFNFRVCQLWCNEEALRKEWICAAETWNGATEEECQRVWDNSDMSTCFRVMAAAVLRKGIRLPAVDAAMAKESN